MEDRDRNRASMTDSSDKKMRYLSIIRKPDFAKLFSCAALITLSGGLIPFGAVSVFSNRHEFFYAGMASASFLLVISLVAPAKGRIVDRFGAQRVLPILLYGFSLCIFATCVSVWFSFPKILSLVLIAASAATMPSSGAILRSVWTAISASPTERQAIHALSSVIEEGIFVISPLIVSAVWAVVGPTWAIALGGLTLGIGVILLLATAKRGSLEVKAAFEKKSSGHNLENRVVKRRKSVFFNPKGFALFLPMAALGTIMGFSTVLFPAWISQRYPISMTGVVDSVISASGILSGLIYGKINWDGISRWTQYSITCVMLGLGLSCLALSESIFCAVFSATIIGLSMTPMFIIGYMLIGDSIDADLQTEANASLGAAYNFGSGGVLFVLEAF